MTGHGTISMSTIYFTTNTHTLITLPTKQFIFVLPVILTVPKIQDWFLTQWLPIMLTRYLIFMMFKITILTKVSLFCHAVMCCHHVLATLTEHFLSLRQYVL